MSKDQTMTHRQALRLTKIDFDSMENEIGNARCRDVVGYFIDSDDRTARAKVAEAIAALPPERTRDGWDGERYPQYKVEEIALQ